MKRPVAASRLTHPPFTGVVSDLFFIVLITIKPLTYMRRFLDLRKVTMSACAFMPICLVASLGERLEAAFGVTASSKLALCA